MPTTALVMHPGPRGVASLFRYAAGFKGFFTGGSRDRSTFYKSCMRPSAPGEGWNPKSFDYAADARCKGVVTAPAEAADSAAANRSGQKSISGPGSGYYSGDGYWLEPLINGPLVFSLQFRGCDSSELLIGCPRLFNRETRRRSTGSSSNIPGVHLYSFRE